MKCYNYIGDNMKKKHIIFLFSFLIVIALLVILTLDKELKDDGVDTGIKMGYCTILPDQYGLVFTHTDKTIDKVKKTKLLKVTINDEEAEVEEINDGNVFNDLSDFMGKKVLYYANLTNSFEYEKELEIVTFMEVTLENGEKVTQKFTDKVEIDGYGGF